MVKQVLIKKKLGLCICLPSSSHAGVSFLAPRGSVSSTLASGCLGAEFTISLKFEEYSASAGFTAISVTFAGYYNKQYFVQRAYYQATGDASSFVLTLDTARTTFTSSTKSSISFQVIPLAPLPQAFV